MLLDNYIFNFCLLFWRLLEMLMDSVESFNDILTRIWQHESGTTSNIFYDRLKLVEETQS